ncbi:MAG: FAD-binding oxidoreductase [Deltaproteobacteria bacterium]|nr:FAD-binding oxidoreductase [Deltaproteobacteria bacterium]
MAQTADAIIIGAGIHGCSLAFHLAEKGVKSVVLERKVVAAGGTGRSSGLVRMHYDNRPEAELTWASFQYFNNWKERVGVGNCDFQRTGFIQIVKPNMSEALRKNVAMQQEIGIPTMVVGPDDVKRLAPQFVVEDIEVAAYEPNSGYADATAAAMGFMNAAKEMGAALVQDCAVTDINVSGGKVTGVQSRQGDYDAPVIVDCAGPWAAPVAKMAGLDIPVDTWRHDTMFIKHPPQMGPYYPTVIDFPTFSYFRPETGGLTLVGLEDNNPIGEDPEGNVDHAKAGFVERAIDYLCQRVPLMEQATFHSAHGGYDGITPDQHAILDQAGPDGFYLQCGMSGTGFKIAPAIGACMAELIVDGKATTVDLTPFRLSRYQEGTTLDGEFSYGNMWL